MGERRDGRTRGEETDWEENRKEHTQTNAHCDNGDICRVPVVACGGPMAHSDGL